MNDESKPDMHKILFSHLVTMLSMSVMQQLGKLQNPMTGKAEVQLEAAQATIDILDMLEAKTKGNLDKDEEKLLKDTLSSIKLNYVETAETEKSKKPVEPSGKEKATEPSAPPPEQTKEQTKEREHKDPKYHKSYE